MSDDTNKKNNTITVTIEHVGGLVGASAGYGFQLTGVCE